LSIGGDFCQGPIEVGRTWCYGSTMTRAELHRLLDELPEASLEPVAQLLTRARDPFLARLDAALDDDEPMTVADREALADTSPGIPLEQVERELWAD